MMKPKGALDLIEEAIAELRTAPAGVWISYYAGSFLFVLCLLYFWADMSRSAFAHRHVAESAFGVSLLYIWMKCWQSVFASRMYDRLLPGRQARRSASRINVLRLILIQAILQPYSLFLLPLAFIVFLPFGWVYAHFHNISLIGNGGTTDVRAVWRKSWKLALLWPAQNHRLILILSLFSIVLFLNVAVVIFFIPQLIRTLFGIESAFTMSPLQALNTTFLTVVCGVTYLLVNPLLKTVYVLRCFYGESVHSGADLIAELNLAPPEVRSPADSSKRGEVRSEMER